MDEGSKQRLVGTAVLVGLVVIFVPMLFEERDRVEVGDRIEIPQQPDFDATYQDSLSGAPDPANLDATEKGQGYAPLALPLPERPGDPASARPVAAEPLSRQPPLVDSSARVPVPEQPTTSRSVAPVTPSAPTNPPRASEVRETPVTGWVVQVASLSERDKAIGLRDELRRAGYKVFVESARVGGKDYYRVRIGPEASRSRAETLSQRLIKETRYKPLVQRYP